MNDEIFARYAQLKRQITLLEDQMKELQPQVTEELKKLPDAKLKTPFGMFNIMRRAKWSYSEAVQQIEDQLKSQQKAEQESGTAKAEYTEYVPVQGCGRRRGSLKIGPD